MYFSRRDWSLAIVTCSILAEDPHVHRSVQTSLSLISLVPVLLMQGVQGVKCDVEVRKVRGASSMAKYSVLLLLLVCMGLWLTTTLEDYTRS